MQESNQRVWVARHVVVLIQTLFGVLYSVGYLPQLLNKLGLSFHKAVTTLIKRDSEKCNSLIKPDTSKDRFIMLLEVKK
jgi:transposase